VNSTPQLGTIPIEPNALPIGSPPSSSLFGPEGPLERVTKQRGKVAIGVNNNSTDLVDVLATNNQRPDSQSLGQDQDGWFVVDVAGRRNSLLLDSRPRLEFGRFDSPNPPLPPNTRNDHHRSGSMAQTRRVLIGDTPKSARETRRGSTPDNFGTALSHRNTSHAHVSSGTRRGGGGRGARAHHRTGPGHGSARSISGPNYRPPPHALAIRGYGPAPFDPSDPYGYQMMGLEYPPYYLPPEPLPMPPYMGPYAGYPPPAVAPGYGPPNGAAPIVPAGPPIPMPSTPTANQLDPLRFWLLGQVRKHNKMHLFGGSADDIPLDRILLQPPKPGDGSFPEKTGKSAGKACMGARN
jgi:hypothetical protein